MIICYVDLKEPSNEYLEFALHPANNTGNTPKDEIANVNITPKCKSDNTAPRPNGITAQPKIDKVKDEIGANTNKRLSEVVG